MRKRSLLVKSVGVLGVAAMLSLQGIGGEPATGQAKPENPVIGKYAKQYEVMLNSLRAELKAQLPKVTPADQKAFDEAAKGIRTLGGPLWKAQKTKDPKEREQKVKAVYDTLAKARADLLSVLKKTGIQRYLESDALDNKLVKFVVLNQGTPRGLAEFAAQSDANAALIEKLLGDTELMKAMVVADGPEIQKGMGMQYGPAMKIYTDIQKASSKASSGVLKKLALAIALEHSLPVGLRNATGATDAPTTADPIKRYLSFEKAYLGGELDAGFKTLTAFEMRFAVNGEAPDNALAWGRETMRNFRPDHVMQESEGRRYVGIVSSDVKYGSNDCKYDRPELEFFQNILMNGGICGRRAAFARFACRAFGVPAIRRPSKGHAALARWTSSGWRIVLGPGWGRGKRINVLGRYSNDLDFRASTEARENAKEFMKVKRAFWAAEVMGEDLHYSEFSKPSGKKKKLFWSHVALKTQRIIIQENKINPTDEEAVDAKLGEADGEEKITPYTHTPKDMKITCGNDGVITIPAVAFVTPKSPTKDVLVMRSFGEGKQVFFPRFFRGGTSILRGRNSANRLLSAGYGKYPNWGLRAAMTHSGGDAPKEIKVDLGNGVAMEFVYIKPGTFVMGGEETKGSKWAGVEVPKHEVSITKGFYMGKYEVTQAQFETIMGFNTSNKGQLNPNAPVDTVSATDAFMFCRRAALKTKRGIRLPTEAEWEYACRAGSTTEYFFGDDKSKLGDYSSGGGKPTYPVGQKKPNPWGLYDIYGNVHERVADVYAEDYYANSPKKDPVGPILPPQSVVEYAVDVPKAGNYELSVKTVTVNYNQQIFVGTNGSKGNAKTITLPFTCGKWKTSAPVVLSLDKGKNTIKLWRSNPPQKGVAVKSFSLKPVR